MDAKQKPLAGVDVSPASIAGHKIPWGTGLLKESSTDSEGVVSLEGVGYGSEVFLNSEKFGNHRLAIQRESDRAVVQLPDLGSVKVKYALPEGVDRKILNGKKVIFVTGNSYSPSQDTPQPVSWRVVQLDDDASSEVDNLMYEQLYVGLIDPLSLPVCTSFRDLKLLTLTAGNSPLEVTEKLYKAREVVFKFVDESGKPVNGIQSDPLGGVVGRAGENGTVTIKVPKEGKLGGQLFPFDPSGRFQVLGNAGLILDRLEIENSEVKPITMTRSRSLHGRVIDEQGNVVAGAKVDYSIKSGPFTINKSVLSDNFGNFRINRLPPKTSVKIVAKKGSAATPDGESISVISGSNEVVSLGLVAQPVAAITGVVKSKNGQPIPNAHVKLFRAKVIQEEGFGSEDLNATDLVNDFDGVKTDQDGIFRYPKTTSFKERIQVMVSAPGFRNYRHPFIDGSRKKLSDSEISFGEFNLFELPKTKRAQFTVASADNGGAIDGAEVVLLGIDCGKKMATTNSDGVATLDALDTGQLLAVNANGYALHLSFVDQLADSTKIMLEKATDDRQTVPWLKKQWQGYHAVAKSLIEELDAPGPKNSTYYRQSLYFSALITANFPEFKKRMEKPKVYEYQQHFMQLNAAQIFLNAPAEFVNLLRDSSLSPDEKVNLLGLSAMLSDDADLKDELYGEAIAHLDECPGNSRMVAMGSLAARLAIDGEIQVAKDLVTEEWNNAEELKDQLKSELQKARVVESRTFTPLVALIDPDAAIGITRLTAIENELPGLLTQCMTFASIGGHDVSEVCKRNELKVDLSGLTNQLEETGISNARYEITAKWIRDHLDSMRASSGMVAATIFAARHFPDGKERDRLIARAATAWQDCSVSYHWDDPAKEILEELPKFDSIALETYDGLLFAAIKHAPDKVDAMQLGGVYANLFKIIAVRDSAIARKLLDPAFENGAWLYGEPTWSAFEHNQLIEAYAWIDPQLAAQKARELADEYAGDDSVRKIQLMTKVISELNDIAIGKGMLQGR